MAEARNEEGIIIVYRIEYIVPISELLRGKESKDLYLSGSTGNQKTTIDTSVKNEFDDYTGRCTGTLIWCRWLSDWQRRSINQVAAVRGIKEPAPISNRRLSSSIVVSRSLKKKHYWPRLLLMVIGVLSISAMSADGNELS